eukprot:gene5702-9522_t
MCSTNFCLIFIAALSASIYGLFLNTFHTTPHVTQEQIKADGGFAFFKDGRTIEYFLSGDSNGVPLVWLHGAGSTGKTGLHAGKLAKKFNLNVISVSLPGSGGTSPIQGRGFFEAAKDIIAVVDFLKIDKFHIQGVSYGSGHAAAVAELVPSRVISLQIVVPAWPSMSTFDSTKNEGIIAKLLMGRISIYYTAKIPMKLIDVLRTIAPEDVAYVEKNAPQNFELGQADSDRAKKYHHEGNTEIREILLTKGNELFEKIKILDSLGSKVSIWSGLADTIAPPFNGKFIKSILPKSKLFEFENLGHLGMLADWTKFYKEMKKMEEK